MPGDITVTYVSFLLNFPNNFIDFFRNGSTTTMRSLPNKISTTKASEPSWGPFLSTTYLDHKQYRMFCKPGRGVYAFIVIKLRSIPDFCRNFTYFKATLHLVEYRQSNNFIMFATAVLYGKRQSFCWHVNGVHCVHSCILMSCSFQEVTSIPQTDS